VSARTLLEFAAAENETWANNSTGIFNQLFHYALSGTQATPTERLAIIDLALSSKSEHKIKVAVNALSHALKTQMISRTVGSENQGSGPPLKEWGAKTWREIHEYRTGAITRLKNVALKHKCELSKLAKECISESVHSFVHVNQVAEICAIISEVAKSDMQLWVDCIESIKRVLKRWEDLNKKDVKKLEKTLDTLSPNKYEDKFKLYIDHASWHDHEEGADGKFIDKSVGVAEKFAKQTLKNVKELYSNFDLLFKGELRKGWVFGKVLGEGLKDYKKFLTKALKYIRESDEFININVLNGFLYIVGKKDKKHIKKNMDKVVGDKILVKYLVRLTTVLTPTKGDLDRIILAMRNNLIANEELLAFKYGSCLDHLDEIVVCEFIEAISKQGSSWVAFEVLYMYCYARKERFKSNAKTFKSIQSSEGFALKDFDAQTGLHSWEKVSVALLKAGDDNIYAVSVVDCIIRHCSDPSVSIYRHDSGLHSVVNELLNVYWDEVWPRISDILIGDEGGIPFFNIRTMLGSDRFSNEDIGTLFRVDGVDKKILSWCKQFPKKAPSFIASIVPLYSAESGGKDVDWSTLAKTIIDMYGNDKDVLSSLDSNMHSFGWSGSLVPHLLTRKKMFENLSKHKYQAVKSWARDCLNYVEENIKNESVRDSEREAGIHY